MDDVVRVRIGQPARNLNCNVDDLCWRYRTVLNTVGQRLALIIGHDNERVAVVGLFNAVDHARVGVIERRRDACLFEEALFVELAGVKSGRKEFQGDEAFELSIAGLVDHPHAARTNAIDNLIG